MAVVANRLPSRLAALLRPRRSERRPATRGIVVMMHEVHADPEHHALELSTGLTAHALESIVIWLRDNGWDIVTLEAALARLRRRWSRRRFAVLTFDDGYRDTLTRALPTLQRHDAPFTVYVPNGAVTRELHSWWLGLRVLFARNDHVTIPAMDMRFECADHASKVEGLGRASSWVHADYSRAALLADTFESHGISLAGLNEAYFLDVEQLRALAQHPLATVGAHTVSHRPLALLSDAEAREELTGNRRFLEGMLDRDVTDLAYPYGNPASCGEREFAVAAQTGFRSAVTTRYGGLTAADKERLHALPRVAAGGTSGFHAFAAAVAAL